MSREKGRSRERILRVLECLSEERARAVLDFAEYLNERQEWEATVEILKDARMMEELREAEEDVSAGRLHRWEDVKRSVKQRPDLRDV